GDPSGFAQAVAVQQDDGKIVVAGGGGYHDASSVIHTGFAIARFNPGSAQSEPGAGLTLDSTFGNDGTVITPFDPTWYWGFNPGVASARAVAITSDHRII